MNRRLLLAASLLSATQLAQAQKARDFVQFEALDFSLVPGQAQVLLYSNLSDTTAKPSARLPRTSLVPVVGEFSPRWAIIKKAGISYFMRQADLLGLSKGQTVKQVADLINAPLPLDADTHLIDFSQVVQAPGVAKDELYARGKVWFANAFKSAQDVIQADDKAAGILIGKGWQTAYVPNAFGSPVAVQLWYTVKFAFKDGRYRYTITDFKFEYPATPYNLNPGRLPAERLTAATKKDGTLTNPAHAHARAVSLSAHNIGRALELSMAKPSTGTDF